MNKRKNLHLIEDLALIFISIIVAGNLASSNFLTFILKDGYDIKFISSFIAGLFFTSVFTVAISAVALAKIATTTSIWSVVLFGGLGAVIGDLIIFLFVEKRLDADMNEIIKGPKHKKLRNILRSRIFKFVMPLIGALVIASPLPDEIGIAMMGFSKMSPKYFVPISFLANALGILIIAIAAQKFL